MMTELKKLATLALAVVFASGTGASAQEAASEPPKAAEENKDLTELNLDELMNVQVTTASRKAESLFGVAAALSVITSDDIKRSGATNIPEALRLVPGVQVARINAQQYAVTIRGFNSRFANRLLVLIDGRSIYNSLYGGVYWEDYNIAMEDIERIEVIRGPGGSLWGANAVNGIVNIITKNSKDTKGWTLDQQSSTNQMVNSSVLRYGGDALGGTFRLTGQGLTMKESVNAAGNGTGDGMNGGRASLRFDRGTDEGGKWMFSADYQRMGQDFAGDTMMSERSNVLARYSKVEKNGSSNQVQVFFDKEMRNVFSDTEARASTIDFDYQHSLATLGAHNVTVGAGFRTVSDDLSTGAKVLSDPKKTFNTFSAYAQDDWRLSSKMKLAIGLKLEHNDFSGFEYQPSVRLSYMPNDAQAGWLSVSRAVRTPNRIQRSIDAFAGNVPLGGGQTGQVRVFGDPDFPSSKVIAAEAGFRSKLTDKVILDVAAFHNSYDNLDGFQVGAPFVGGNPPGVIIPNNLVVKGKGQTYGVEMSTKIQATDKWRMDVGYGYLDGAIPATARGLNAPKHQFFAQSSYDLTPKLSFDQALYYSGPVPSASSVSWTKLDLQLRYKASKDLEFAVGGRNLGSPRTGQTGTVDFTAASQVQPELFIRATVRF